MHRHFDLALIISSTFTVACATEPAVSETPAAASFGNCGLADEVLAVETLTPVAIPNLSALERAQIVEAVRESAHTDVTTVEEAFQRVDQHEINRIVLWDDTSNRFYLEVEYGAGDNSYGAIFYWDTAVKAAAIHDGFQEECGPIVFDYGAGDTAPECAGFLTYVNTASFAALDAYLPSNVAQSIVDTRAVVPFASVASVVAVNGVAEARLQQLLAAARVSGDVGASCSGIYDQVAVSTTEADQVVALVNEASANELHGILAFLLNQTVVGNLTAQRPFANAGAVALTSGVGPAVFRTLRNSARRNHPWEQLVAAINRTNEPDRQIRVDLHFDWVPLVTGAIDFTSMDCFGIAPAQLPPGATLRPQPATGNEVMENAGEAVAHANIYGDLGIDPTPGLTDLEYRTAGGEFLGCYVSYHPNPWVYDRQAFFVDLDTGASVLITTHYVE